jgi:hypothetical protein
MTRVVPQYDWRLFRFAVTRASLYVLGAGASLPIITHQIAERIRKAVWDIGSFEAVYEPPSALKKRLLAYDIRFDIDAFFSDSISQNTLDLHTSNALLEALFAREITVPGATLPPQYEIFNYLPASVVFNFNNDNLADGIHPRHLHLRPHGAVDYGLVHSPMVSRAIEYSAVPDSFPLYLEYHRPLPEPNNITARPAYRTLARHFEDVGCVVLIGYSFGEQRAAGSIDDVESFEMLTDLLRWRPKPVLIVGPDPEQLCFRVEAAIRKSSVTMLRCRWNVLAEFMLSDAFGMACEQVHRKSLQLITCEYRRFEGILDDDRDQSDDPDPVGVIVRFRRLRSRKSWPLF